MKIQLTRNLLYQILFAICVWITYLNIYELTFAVWMFTFLFTIKQSYSLTMIRFVLCFAAIFAIALISSTFHEFKSYNFFRDITYMVKPPLGLLIGYQLCRNKEIKPFHTIIYVGLSIALIHLGMVAYNVVVYRVVNIHELRNLTGYFSEFEVYALLVVIFCERLGVSLPQNNRRLFIVLIGVSSFLYLSRTDFLQFLIMFLAMKGYFRLNKRALVIISMVILASGGAYTVIYNMNFTRNGTGLEALMYKIKNAPIEAFKTKINTDDYRDFNDNYRSYENIITVKQVSYRGNSTLLLGRGMGSTIDLGRQLWTNDGEFIRYLPTLHNGFMTIYLKSGLCGILAYLIFLYLFSKQAKTDIPLVKEINLFLTGTAIFLILVTWVLLGLYLKIDNKSILIGFILGYKELQIKAASNAVTHG